MCLIAIQAPRTMHLVPWDYMKFELPRKLSNQTQDFHVRGRVEKITNLKSHHIEQGDLPTRGRHDIRIIFR